MILTVTPNAAVDKTYRIEDFRLNRVNRPSSGTTVAGGKGVNLARVYRTLGGQAVVTGFLGGINGRIMTRALQAEGADDAFVHVRGESRICIAVIDPNNGSQTEVNESGPEIPPRAIRALKRRVESLLADGRFSLLTLNGSLPPAAPAELFADFIEIARRAGVRAVLDTSGDALREGAAARPWMVKPNRFELESLTGRALTSEADVLAGARTLLESGVCMVAVTLGEEGAYLITGRGAWRSRPPRIEFASAVASGDSFLAALLWAWERGGLAGDGDYGPEEEARALRLATGAGAANAAVIGAGFCSRESILAAAANSEVRSLQMPGDPG